MALPVLGANWTGDRAGVPPLGGIDPEMPPKGGTPAAVLPRSHLKPEEPKKYDHESTSYVHWNDGRRLCRWVGWRLPRPGADDDIPG